MKKVDSVLRGTSTWDGMCQEKKQNKTKKHLTKNHYGDVAWASASNGDRCGGDDGNDNGGGDDNGDGDGGGDDDGSDVNRGTENDDDGDNVAEVRK